MSHQLYLKRPTASSGSARRREPADAATTPDMGQPGAEDSSVRDAIEAAGIRAGRTYVVAEDAGLFRVEGDTAIEESNLPAGTKVTVMGVHDMWAKVRTESERVGFVDVRNLK